MITKKQSLFSIFGMPLSWMVTLFSVCLLSSTKWGRVTWTLNTIVHCSVIVEPKQLYWMREQCQCWWDRSPKTLSSYDDERNKQHLTFIQLKHSQVTSVYGVWHYITVGWAHLMLHCMNFSPCASLSLMLPPPMLKPSTTARLSPITSRARCLCSFRICHKKRDSHSTLYFIFINFSK